MTYRDILGIILEQRNLFLKMNRKGFYIRGSKGFDRELEDGEAGRRYALNPKLKLNAEDNLAYAA